MLEDATPKKEAASQEDDSPEGRWYRCAACGEKICRHQDAIEVAGRHIHARLNPHGALFAFGCFSSARCAVSGAPTTEATWFPPSAWQYAHCRCGAHLGWYFTNGFYGLVMEKLVE